MPTHATLILHSGGLRSLVATALAAAESDKPRLALLHLLELTPNAATRLAYVRRQAEHYQIRRVAELEMPRIAPLQSGKTAVREPASPSPLQRTQVLVTGLAQAAEYAAERLIWPAQCDGDVRHAAHATELAVLASHLAESELAFTGRNVATVDTPLAELTDRQMIELGVQLDVPWALAWTCTVAVDDSAGPCRACDACRRRHHAFEAAGVVDPLIAAATVR